MVEDEEIQLIRQTAREFAEKEVAPKAGERDETGHFPSDLIQALASLGFMGLLVPEQYGGSDVSFLAYSIVMEEIAKGDGAISTILGVHNSVGCLPIYQYGNETQKKYYLPKMCDGSWLGAFCLTEPQAGSDAKNLKTTAQLKDEYYILNGVKQFITSGKHAKIAIVFAKSDNQINAFIVPTDTQGFHVARLEKKMGQSCSEIAQIVLDNCKIPKKNLLGEPGQGYKIALSNLECGRIGVGAQAVGMGQAALDQALIYAKDRETFGKKLIDHQAVAFKLADMSTRLEAARQLIYHAAQRKDAKLPCLKEAAMAKLFATEAGEYVAREAMQIHGGYGYLKDFPVERIYRDVRVTSIYEGTSDIQKMIIARALK